MRGEKLVPRYFFHTADGSRERDTTGTVLASYEEARAAAIQYAGDVLSHEPEHLWKDSDFRVEVTDEHDLMLFTVIMLAVDAPATGKPPTKP
jgi:hypothetical protein